LQRQQSAAAQNLRRALLTPLYGSEAAHMKRRDISIATGAAVLALQASLTPRWRAAIHLILDRIDERIGKLEAKP
jgi:hypothetical protein